jgi:hypothetical protein
MWLGCRPGERGIRTTLADDPGGHRYKISASRKPLILKTNQAIVLYCLADRYKI